MPFTLVFAVFAFTLLYATLVTARLQLAELEEGKEERELEQRDRTPRPCAGRNGARLMDHNWGYVAAGFTITFVTLAAYSGWLWQRLRRTRRSLADEGD